MVAMSYLEITVGGMRKSSAGFDGSCRTQRLCSTADMGQDDTMLQTSWRPLSGRC
jgi:hypothetical protein